MSREGLAVVPSPIGALPVIGTEVAIEHLFQRALLLAEDVIQSGADIGRLHARSDDFTGASRRG